MRRESTLHRSPTQLAQGVFPDPLRAGRTGLAQAARCLHSGGVQGAITLADRPQSHAEGLDDEVPLVPGLPGAAQIVGRVNMDQIVIDVTDLPSIALGATVQLISDHADSVCALPKLARLAESSCYEMLCRISSRVTRKYIGKPLPSSPAPEIHIPQNTEKLIPRPAAKLPN